MIVTVFRARVRAEAQLLYAGLAPKLAALAATMPGYISHKVFVAEDGERATVVEFDTLESLRAWSHNADHVEAKKAGRREIYATYKVQVCDVVRERSFGSDPPV